LRNAELFGLYELILDLVSDLGEIRNDLGDRITRHGEKTVHVLGDKHHWFHTPHQFNEGLVECSPVCVEPLTFPRMTEILARKSPSHHFGFWKLVVLGKHITDVSEMVIVGPAVQFGDLFGFGQNIVLEDGLER